ncbi:MAG: DNA-processing protein DprA [Oscillospiraceae bacterium]|nr:DNA-processing protein DprA [Oscillospiraceae bacterium]
MTAYWIWLQVCLGTNAKTGEIMSLFESPHEIYKLTADEKRRCGAFTHTQLDRFKSFTLENAEGILKRCRENGWQVVTPDSGDYPALLREIPNYPPVLYAIGDLSCLRERLAIAVVGSRSASESSINTAGQLCLSLAKAGAVVVSGGALGVDSAAHAGAIHGGGRTVAVLGCGLNVPYLMQNAELRGKIAENGALVSEFLPDTPVYPANFPVRNRLISGMCHGTVVVEANERSGSLITARHALDQNRDVFAVPGSVTDPSFAGSNKLIRDGVKPLFSSDDLLVEYSSLLTGGADLLSVAQDDFTDIRFKASEFVHVKHGDNSRSYRPQAARAKPKAERPREKEPAVYKKQKRALPDYISKESAAVYGAFDIEPVSMDELVRGTGMEPNRILQALTELEIYGFIMLIEGKRYTLL